MLVFSIGTEQKLKVEILKFVNLKQRWEKKGRLDEAKHGPGFILRMQRFFSFSN